MSLVCHNLSLVCHKFVTILAPLFCVIILRTWTWWTGSSFCGYRRVMIKLVMKLQVFPDFNLKITNWLKTNRILIRGIHWFSKQFKISSGSKLGLKQLSSSDNTCMLLRVEFKINKLSVKNTENPRTGEFDQKFLIFIPVKVSGTEPLHTFETENLNV